MIIDYTTEYGEVQHEVDGTEFIVLDAEGFDISRHKASEGNPGESDIEKINFAFEQAKASLDFLAPPTQPEEPLQPDLISIGEDWSVPPTRVDN